MRRYLIRLLVLLSMFGLGISLAMVWSIGTSPGTIPPIQVPIERGGPELLLPLVPFDPCIEQASSLKEASFVVAIADNNDLYVGREQVELDDVTQMANRLLESKLCQCRGAFIKASDKVKYGTVVSVIEKLKEACVNKIGLVRDKKAFKKTRGNNM